MTIHLGLENFEKVSEEVMYSKDSRIVRVNSSQVEQLVAMSEEAARRRIRICAHSRCEDLLHEMIIVHAKGTYVRPHKHLGRAESFHVISGRADVVVFDAVGEIFDVIKMGDFASGDNFYYRLNINFFHCMLIYSDHLVFQETTMGPFDSSSTVFAPWAPSGDDSGEVLRFLETTISKVQCFFQH